MLKQASTFLVVLCAFFLVNCTGPTTTDGGGDGGPEADGGENVCGDSMLDDDEACDGDVVSCNSLNAYWIMSGTATCRNDCQGFDMSDCSLDTSSQSQAPEVVKPATRYPEKWASARCNDGTPFSFQISLAPATTNEWVIMLGGGGLCDDDAVDCEKRIGTQLVTTLSAADGATALFRADGSPVPFDEGGILARNVQTNSRFAAVNIVWANYCSSDFWAGASDERRPTTGDPVNGWYFSGRHSVASLFDVLEREYGLNDEDPALRVLFSGTSAGGFGVALNADTAISYLPNTAANDRLRLFIDAAFTAGTWNDSSFTMGASTQTTDRDVFRAAWDFWGAEGPKECTDIAMHPGDCILGPSYFPALAAASPAGLELPVLIQQATMDVFPLKLHRIVGTCNIMGCTVLDQPAHAEWRVQQIAALTEAAPTWRFGGDLHYHNIAVNTGWGLGPTGGPTLHDYVADFFDDTAPYVTLFDAEP